MWRTSTASCSGNSLYNVVSKSPSLCSAGLDQNGSDDEGINGFLAKDIVKEWRRGSRLLCIYCKGKYATIGCVGNKCK